MRSSSTERAERAWWSAGAGTWLRLVLVLGLGAAALLGPRPATTDAVLTDQESVTVTVRTAPTSPAPPEE